MKRGLVLILALLYITATSGVAISVHWCMGRVAGTSVAFAESDHHACKRCGMEKRKKGGCCHDEHKLVKAGADQSLAAKTALQSAALAAIIPVREMTATIAPTVDYTVLPSGPAHSPPLIDDAVPRYLRLRSIRI